jgi:hypothetical protein
MSENKKYVLGGKDYSAKEKYSLTIWGKIIALLQGFDATDTMAGIVVLLADGNLVAMLNLILSETVKDELFEEDFEEVGKIINDFFTRKSSLINIGKGSLKN